MTLGIGLIIAAIAVLALVVWSVAGTAARAHARVNALWNRLERDFAAHQVAMAEATGRIEDLSTAQTAMAAELDALKPKRRQRKDAQVAQ